MAKKLRLEGSFATDEHINSLIDVKIADLPSGGSVPKPLTYDYMPEGYPSKSGVQTVTLMEEQEVIFSDIGGGYGGIPMDALSLIEGQTYIVSWDGTEYECVCFVYDDILVIGNLSVTGFGEDSGEPFVYFSSANTFGTLDTSPSHTISVKTTEEVVTPMAEEFLPATVAEIKETANNAQTTANNAKTAAANAQTTANNAKTAAATAQTVADLKFQIYQHSESVSVEVGTLSAHGSKSFENLNIKNGSIVSVTTSVGLSGEALWTGAQTCSISMQNSVGAHIGSLQINLNSNRKYTITNLSNAMTYADLVITYQKVEVPQRRVYGPNYGAWLPPYMIVPCLYLTAPYSSTGGSKLYCLTVDDSGVPSFTNTEDSTEVWTPSDCSGEDGATFTPSVSADGTLSWTNDKGLANPDPVNINGPAGADGQSAYVAAQTGGYTDTQENFYADLAAVQGLASALAAI